MNDHDLLVRIDERVLGLENDMRNHLRHHWVVSVSVLVAVLTAAGSMLVALVMR